MKQKNTNALHFNVQTHETDSLEKTGVSLDRKGKCIKPLGFMYVCWAYPKLLFFSCIARLVRSVRGEQDF